MIIAKLQGGMGNQLFQYAMARSVSLSSGSILKVDTSFYLYARNRSYALDYFETDVARASFLDEGLLSLINIPLIEKEWESIYSSFFSRNFRIIREPDQYTYAPVALDKDEDVFLIGFWQNEKYFAENEPILRRELVFRHDLKYPQALLSQIKNTNSISIHVRRGDYLRSSGFAPCSPRYYSDAISFFSSQMTKPHFFIFSDDLVWSKEHFSHLQSATFVEYENTNDGTDLFLMSKCKHHIIANSTFSWWGAWLNTRKSKKVVAPAHWLEASPKSDQIISKAWIKI